MFNKYINRLLMTASSLVLALLLAACVEVAPNTFNGTGLRPVYIPLIELDAIDNSPPQAIVNSGTIFLLDTLFFMLEQGRGIHVFSVSDPANAVGITFINIPATTAFTVSDGRIYADSWRDLVTIDISNLRSVQLLSRQRNVFQPLFYPPLYNGIFECVDETKGAVAGWEQAELSAVSCRTIN